MKNAQLVPVSVNPIAYQNLTAFAAMKLAIINCNYLHQLENLIEMYNSSDFCREDQDLLILLFYKYIDKLATVKDYNHICSLKLKVIL